MALSFILIHSPLVGPFTWSLVADELRREGHIVIVPSFMDALTAESGFASAMASSVSYAMSKASTGQPPYLVPHSAAGAFTPAIRESIGGSISGYIFLDARLPKRGMSLSRDDASTEVESREAMARDGWLPPWSEWVGEEAMMDVLPDDEIREEFKSELVSIPLTLFEEPIPVFNSWPDAHCAYIRLSEFYGPLVGEARSLGWPVIERDGKHLDMLVDPVGVAKLILEMAEMIESIERKHR